MNHALVDSFRDYALVVLSPTGEVVTWNADDQKYSATQRQRFSAGLLQ